MDRNRSLHLGRRLWPERLTPELTLAFTAGTLFGTGDVLVKGATGQAQVATGGFHVLDAASLGAMAATTEFGTAVALYAASLVMIHVAYSIGRVSVIAVVAGIGGTILPILFGFAVLREAVDPGRAVGTLGLLVGAALQARSAPLGTTAMLERGASWSAAGTRSCRTRSGDVSLGIPRSHALE